MNSVTLSLYIPVYNAEKYLPVCLDSILSQTFTDYEVIIYDDGSSDSSCGICKKYADRDERITFEAGQHGYSIDKMNQFVRNAKGKYIGFVDNDDVLEADYFEKMINLIEQKDADCVISSYTYIDGNGCKLPWHSADLKDGEILDRNQVLRMFLTSLDIEGFRWNKIYRKEVFTSNKVEFGNKYPADIPGEFQLLLHVNKVVLSGSKGYYYRQIPTSDVATVSISKLDRFISTFEEVSVLAAKYGYEDDARYYFTWRSINSLYGAYRSKDKYDANEWDEYFKDFTVKNWLGLTYWQALKLIVKQHSKTNNLKYYIKMLIVFLVYR